MNPPPHSAGHHGLGHVHLPSPAPRRSGKKTTNNLVALGSAAVLAVYAAGYMRTKSAAQRFDGDGGGRRQPLVTKGTKATAPTTTTAPLIGPPAPAPVTTLTPAAPVEAITQSPVAPAAAPAVVPTLAAAEPTAAPAVAIDPWIPNATRLPVPAYVPPAPPVATTPPPVSAKIAETSGTAAAAVHSEWKDGKYSGWGSCRHGDIQALVEIKGGRIVSAIVSSCRTVYSCDVISKVVPQVVTRQSADVDSVSGSTQSADAFFWAVSSALADAKTAMAETKTSVPAAK